MGGWGPERADAAGGGRRDVDRTIGDVKHRKMSCEVPPCWK